MADSKISELPSGAPAQASDEYIVARGSANYKLTLTNIAASMPPIGATTPNSGAFTTLSASSTVSGAGFTSYLASPPAIGGTAPNTGAFTTLSASGAASFADGTSAAPAITNTGDTNTGVYFPAADEVAVAAGGTVAAAFNSNGVFFRNRIINGDMRIDQRNAGASVTTSAGANVFCVDRWFGFATSPAVYTMQQDASAPAGFVNSVKVTVTTPDASLAASDFNSFRYIIEGLNVADLGWGSAGAQAVTISFWVRSSLTGTFTVGLRNSAVNRSYIATYAISSADTWEYKTITIPGDTTGTWLTTNGVGIRLDWNLGSGSDYQGIAGSWTATNDLTTAGAVNVVGTNGATFYLTGVQLETGSVATPFERRPYGTELALCQRYYYRLTPGAVTQPLAFGSNSSTTISRATVMFPVEMRVAPTALEQSGTANQYAVFQLGVGAVTCSVVPTFSFGSTRFTVIVATVSSGLTQFNPAIVSTDTTNGANAYLGWSAEL